MTSTKIVLADPYVGGSKMIHFSSGGGGRYPQTAREWLRCVWNADIFVGEVPLLKTYLLLNIFLG